MYAIQRPSRSEFIPIRTIRYHVRQWGQPRPGQPPLVLLHGWMDVAASYQFMVDALAQDRHILAPDWRGFGQTGSGGADSFWFPDYLADLDFLLDHYAPGQAVDLVGHSMGGHVAMLYAGVRPERIRRLVNLEGFGMPATKAAQAPGRFAQWMDGLHSLHQGEMGLKTYPDLRGVARRLMKTNPRLPQDKADWLAQHWSAPTIQNDGTRPWQILGDPAHKLRNPQLFRVDEAVAVYQRITAPTLSVEASDDSLARWGLGYTLAEYHERLQSVPQATVAVVQDAGHMLHHDQPAALARLVEDFLAE
ncbi:alpha/beta hydrolase [Rhodoferax sp.]|uniref:alpha/beta fold hydrolase n=1 Tax=Rhodoferax sp. TaxID=50421 RepID=UPI0025FDF9A6|nr:alpha/beta hydrolase [Rhodoferax sp.]